MKYSEYEYVFTHVKINKMSVIYVVLTHTPQMVEWVHPESEDRHLHVQRLISLCDKYPSYICVLEKGKSGTHFHYNILVRTDKKQSNTSYVRKIFTGYYMNWKINKNTIRCVDHTKDLDISYIFKEDEYEIIGVKNWEFNEEEERAKAIQYREANPRENGNKWQMIGKNEVLNVMETYIVENNVEINDYEDFINMLFNMKRNRICMLDVMSKPKHYFSMISTSQMGDDKFVEILTNNGVLN